MMNRQYKLGYYSVIIDELELELYDHLRECSNMCERFVIGIPDDVIMARIFGDAKKYSCEKTKSLLMDLRWVDDVIILDHENISRQKIQEQISYDVCFYGSEYGKAFEEDKRFMEEKGVVFLPVVPNRLTGTLQGDALKIALENVPKEKKIVLFGTGAYFDYYMKNYSKRYKPAYAIDNASDKWNTKKEGVLIQSPEILKQEKQEDVLVIICSKNYQGILEQLKGIGDYDYRTMLINNKIALLDEYAIANRDEQNYLSKSHDILIHLLKEFDRVCEKYGLHYYVICGSLIGIIRHKDMIPWDDDVDVAMPRSDFDKLKQIAAQEWNTDEFTFLDYDELGNGAFLDCLPRLFYNKETLPTKVYDKVDGKATADVKNKMFVDIYILDNAAKSNALHMFVMTLMKGVYTLSMGHRAPIKYEEYERLPKLTLAVIKLAHLVGRCLPLKLLVSLFETLRKYANKKQCDDFYMANCAITCIERRFKQEFFREGQRMKMREIEVTVPSDYDGLLNAMGYKNYMQFPPMSVRKPSHYFNSDIIIW